MDTHINTHRYIPIYTHVGTYHTHIHKCTFIIYLHACTLTYIYTHIYIHSHTYVHTTQCTQPHIHTLLPFFGYQTPSTLNKTGDLQIFYLSPQNFSSMIGHLCSQRSPDFTIPNLNLFMFGVLFLLSFISIEDIAVNETPSHPKTFHPLLAFPYLSCVPCLLLCLFRTTCSLS